jgi:hypothetical protein
MSKTRALDKLKEKTADLKPPVFTQEIFIKSNLVVLPELRNLIPPLREDEFQQLESNLLANGIKDPLTIWETTAPVVAAGLGEDSTSRGLLPDPESTGKVYVLIDGHNRFDLARKHKLDYRINILDFEDLEKVRDYMINFQLGRRNLTPEQASYLRGLRYNKMKEANRSDRINVAQQLADEYSVSTRTIKRDSDFAKGMDGLSPELKNEVLAGRAKLPKSAAKALARNKPEKPIESLDELNVVLDKMPKSFKSLDELKENREDGGDEKSRRIDNLIREVAGPSRGTAGTREGDMPSGSQSTQALQQELKSLMKEDLTSSEVLLAIITKAQALLEVSRR